MTSQILYQAAQRCLHMPVLLGGSMPKAQVVALVKGIRDHLSRSAPAAMLQCSHRPSHDEPWACALVLALACAAEWRHVNKAVVVLILPLFQKLRGNHSLQWLQLFLS